MIHQPASQARLDIWPNDLWKQSFSWHFIPFLIHNQFLHDGFLPGFRPAARTGSAFLPERFPPAASSRCPFTKCKRELIIVYPHSPCMHMGRKLQTNPRKSASQERSRLTVNTILEATTRVLLKEGYDRASTNKIAAVAGVSIGSLYQYFPSKEALVAAVIYRHTHATMRGDGTPFN